MKRTKEDRDQERTRVNAALIDAGKHTQPFSMVAARRKMVRRAGNPP